jgi:hypothetical protein
MVSNTGYNTGKESLLPKSAFAFSLNCEPVLANTKDDVEMPTETDALQTQSTPLM